MKESKSIFNRKESFRWISRSIETAVGSLPQISSKLSLKDLFDSFKFRLGIGRMKYTVPPGLYGVGKPNPESPVFVSANFKLSFDKLRKSLKEIDSWLLVLDTKGINVWCSAAKGSFSEEELKRQILKTKLTEIVSHRTLILPQLAAVGISAPKVMKLTGFKAIFGPVRASQIPEYLKAGMKASSKMRLVRFNLLDRLVLIPVEILNILKPLLLLFGVLFLLGFFKLKILSLRAFFPYLGAILVGIVLVPLFLPWIPGRYFSLKGWLLGALYALGLSFYQKSLTQILIYFLLLPSISAFFALNFTGSSTYTSLSGVLKEIRISFPLIIISLSLGLILAVFSLLF